MTQRREGAEPLKVQLVEERGVTSRLVHAEVMENGKLVMSGQDVGKAPREQWGGDDYEFVVSVLPEQKDRVLLALLEQAFGGHFSAVDEFCAFLESRDIPFEFWSWA